jgi:hypothetical protein
MEAPHKVSYDALLLGFIAFSDCIDNESLGINEVIDILVDCVCTKQIPGLNIVFLPNSVGSIFALVVLTWRPALFYKANV